MTKKSNEQRVKDGIAKDLANHVVTMKYNFGLYRHYRCQKPGDSNQSFDVVTWPGSLCYTGDMGDYLFQRTDDMIAFMRSSAMSYGYAAEKCNAACRDGIKEFSEMEFRKELGRAIGECATEGDVSSFYALKEILNAGYDNKHEAMTALWDTDYFDELPDCTEYTIRFLWCLHALKWLTEKIDKGEVTM